MNDVDELDDEFSFRQ